MKKLILLAITLAAALNATAAGLSFIRIGHSYTVTFPMAKVSLIVVTDEGDGWYYCCDPRDGAPSYVNLRQALGIEVIEADLHPRSKTNVAPESEPPGDSRAWAPWKVRQNLKLLANAAEDIYLSSAVNVVSYSDLVGPGKAIPVLKPVAGEDYSELNYHEFDRLVIRLGSGQVASYNPNTGGR